MFNFFKTKPKENNFSISSTNISKGDTILIHEHRYTTSEYKKTTVDYYKYMFPENKVVLLPYDNSLTILKKTP